MSTYKVPFNEPCFLGEELDHIKALVSNQMSLAGNGEYSKKCEELLSQQIKSPVLLSTSATHALEMIAILLDLKPGDEIIIPSFTFVSSVNPFLLRGTTVKFVDNDEFGNIDFNAFKAEVTPKTKAVLVMHYAGNSAKLDEFINFCKTNNIALIEDAAQSIGATYNGKPLGTLGTLGCYSFHDTKNITSGEGGALIINDQKLLERAEILREKGTNRTKFLQGLIDKYTWVDLGSSYILSELNAAYLYPQLQSIEKITKKRKKNWDIYNEELQKYCEQKEIQILKIPEYNQPNYHIFSLILKSTQMRSQFIKAMKESGILTPFHYVSLHSSPMGLIQNQAAQKNYKHCDKLSQCLVRLPLFYNLKEEQQSYVIEKVKEWLSAI